MSARPFVIITTRLSPQVCGVGAYSWLLHQHWPDQRSQARFLVVDGAAQSAKELNYPAIAEFNAKPRTLARELERIGSADVLLHYAGRSYQRYGCPRWLPPVLAAWKRKYPSSRLMVLFHELPGNFPITSRFFWIDMCNRRVIRNLARVADVLVTNTAEHAEKLSKFSGRTDVHWFPVASNIPVSANVPAMRARTEFVIFGLPFGRWQTLQMFDAEIQSWHERGRLTKLHLIGPRDERLEGRSEELIGRWRDPSIVIRHGMLPVAGVSNLLASAQFGLVNATAENWSKSAVFMALAAHGCVVVSKGKSQAEPLCFTVAPDEVATISDVDLNQKSQRLQEWYRAHADWNVIANKVAALFSAHAEKEAVA
jgi:hypothetical protein